MILKRKSTALNESDLDSTRFVLLAIWSFSLLISVGLGLTALWLAANGLCLYLSSIEPKIRKKSLSDDEIGWAELGLVGVWGMGPILVQLSNHADKLTISVIMLVCGFLVILGRYRNSVRPAMVVAAPYLLLSVWLLYEALGSGQFLYLAAMTTLIFGTFVTMTIFSVRTHKANQAILAEKETLIDDLKVARDEAERSAKFKSDFLAAMSHEIRTPLNGIVGMADMIGISSREPDTQLRAKTIISCGKSLQNLINEVLDIAKIEADGLTLYQDEFDLGVELNDLENLWTAAAQQKGLSFNVSVDARTPDRHIGDIHRIKQCINNLVGNAIKFTDAGSVQLRVMYENVDGQSVLVFSVLDTGPGISDDFKEELFSPFTQSYALNRNIRTGTGLGLSITKKLSELMGGGIKVYSQAGSGSRFVFWVKTEPVVSEEIQNTIEFETATPVTMPVLSPILSGMTFLIVDDVEHNIVVMEDMIQSLGGRTVRAFDGKEAINTLDQLDVDLIFMDIRMPTMDGIDATKKIRGLSSPKSAIPIIAYSSNVLPSDKSYYESIGMSAHLGKPVTQSALLKVLDPFIETSVQTVELPAAQFG